MKVQPDPVYKGEHVCVTFDLARGLITVNVPPHDPEGFATSIELHPAEAIELAGGLTACSMNAARMLLDARQARPAGTVVDL